MVDHFKSFGIDIGQGKYHEESVYGIALVHTVLFNAISSYLDPFGLTPAKMNVLMIIKHQGKNDGISQVEIGKRLMVTASNMTRLLSKLERDGLIYKSSQVGDKRVKVIKISTKGSKLLDRVWVGYQETIKTLAQHLNLEEQKQMAELLQRWFKTLEPREV